MPTLHACVNAHGGQFEHFLLKLFRFVSVSDIILFNFLNFILTAKFLLRRLSLFHQLHGLL